LSLKERAMRKSTLALMIGLSACTGSNNTPTPTPATGNEWVTFGAGVVPVDANGGFTFPSSSNQAVGYIYKKPSVNVSGKTIILNYTILGDVGTQFIPSPASGTGAASIRLFMWENGDNISCAGPYASYRWWAINGAANLALGNTSISAAVTPALWSNCFGKHGDTVVNEFNGAVNNLLGIGFTFGAEYYGHGVYATTPAKFKINSCTIGSVPC
jgi:hypothetical protein